MEKKTVAIAADHAGYALKEALKLRLTEAGYAVVDAGTDSDKSCDYPLYAEAGCRKVLDGEAELCILCCGTGAGMSIAANKFPGVRAAVVSDAYGARLTRRHNDSNVLCLGGRLLGAWQIAQIVRVWLTTAYDGGHHEGSLELIRQIEAVTMTGARWCPEEQPYPDFDWNPEQSL